MGCTSTGVPVIFRSAMYPDFSIHFCFPPETWKGKYGSEMVAHINVDRDIGCWIVPQRVSPGDTLDGLLSFITPYMNEIELEAVTHYIEETNFFPVRT